MRRILGRLALIALALAAAAALVAFLLAACGCNSMVTAARFSALRSDPTALRAFLQAMPKGADLHVHLSGAVYAEDLIAWAKDKGLCFQLSELSMANPPCDPVTKPPIADALDPLVRGNQALYDAMVNALSMRNFAPSGTVKSGHDQFFLTFGRYGAVTWQIPAEMTAQRLAHYAADAVQHTELMVTLLPSEFGPQLMQAIEKESDSAARLDLLQKGPLNAAVVAAKTNIDGWERAIRERLRCATDKPEPGCKVTYRYIAQVNRNADEANVFVQTAFAAALTRADPRVGGLNFVGPEDYRIARTDYSRHMAMIGFLAKKSETQTDVPVALHAGELWIGLVPPDDLTFHIREAVEIAGARRIGHGVALAYEKRSDQLLAEMRKRPVAIEINLTSNDVILGVRGKDHPLMAYRAAGVPVVLSTDDAGVSRIDLTNEFLRAARDYPLGYRDLKTIARNSIEHSFLSAEAKRDALKQFDASIAGFERSITAERGVLRNTGALIAGWFLWP
jgi:hypothetical protein